MDQDIPLVSEEGRNKLTVVNLGTNMRFSMYSNTNSGEKYFSRQRRMVLNIGPSNLFPRTGKDVPHVNKEIEEPLSRQCCSEVGGIKVWEIQWIW
jgi:hypothetical protein